MMRHALARMGLAARPARLPGAALAAVVVCACAPALKEAPPIVDLAGGGPPPDAPTAAGLLREADADFAKRTLDDVRRAAALYLRVASTEAAASAHAAGAGGAGATGSPARPEGLLGAVRADIWLADHETDAQARESDATRAVQTAQWCTRVAPALPDCDFWLGAALGVQARERPTTGLSAVTKIEALFLRAAERSPDLEEGGPDRALALLYVRAPGWPRGPGDPGLGLEHAKKAVALRPEFPPNRLALAEALAATGDKAGSLEAGREALRLAETRQAAGDPDAAEWVTQARKTIDGTGGRVKRS